MCASTALGWNSRLNPQNRAITGIEPIKPLLFRITPPVIVFEMLHDLSQ